MFKRASRLAALALAIAAAGCSGTDGAQGPQGSVGPTGPGMNGVTGKLSLKIDGVVTSGTTSTVTFTVSPAAAVCPAGVCDDTLSSLGQKTFYARGVQHREQHLRHGEELQLRRD